MGSSSYAGLGFVAGGAELGEVEVDDFIVEGKECFQPR